jgi:hypothetical protein
MGMGQEYVTKMCRSEDNEGMKRLVSETLQSLRKREHLKTVEHGVPKSSEVLCVSGDKVWMPHPTEAFITGINGSLVWYFTLFSYNKECCWT